MYKLLSAAEIRDGLRSTFSEDARKHPAYFAELIPDVPLKQDVQVAVKKMATFAGKKMPDSLVEGLWEWNLGRLTLANINFGRDGDLPMQVERYNAANAGLRWWEDRDEEDRPPNLLMIGQGDSHVILLNLNTGGILAYATDDGSGACFLAACNLSAFLRGLGSVVLHPTETENQINQLTDDLVEQVGPAANRNFWYELAIQNSQAQVIASLRPHGSRHQSSW